jgi:hypothetical protein
MLNREVAFTLILLDARDHRRDCRHVEPGDLLETLLTAYFWEPEGQGKDLSEVRQWLASKGIEVGPRPVYVSILLGFSRIQRGPFRFRWTLRCQHFVIIHGLCTQRSEPRAASRATRRTTLRFTRSTRAISTFVHLRASKLRMIASSLADTWLLVRRKQGHCYKSRHSRSRS